MELTFSNVASTERSQRTTSSEKEDIDAHFLASLVEEEHVLE